MNRFYILFILSFLFVAACSSDKKNIASTPDAGIAAVVDSGTMDKDVSVAPRLNPLDDGGVIALEDATLIADASSDGATTSECGLPSDCGDLETEPEGCAKALCVDGVCVYRAIDADSDEFIAKRCTSRIAGISVETGLDCDDSDPNINPNAWDGPEGDGFEDGCNDDIDQNCNGLIDDGQLSNGATCKCTPGETGKCSQTEAGMPIEYPGFEDGAPVGACEFGTRECLPNGTWGTCTGAVGPRQETCDGEDNDCDGIASTEDPDVIDEATFYCDGDRDDHITKSGAISEVSCTEPASGTGTACPGQWLRNPSASTFDDCDDSDAEKNPDETERCDGKDNDCDEAVDEAGSINEQVWSYDADGDGWRDEAYDVFTQCDNPSSPPSGCTGDCPTGAWVDRATPLPIGDCNDDVASISPTGIEVCNGVDDDCDGLIDAADEGLSGRPTNPGVSYECQNGEWVIIECPADTEDCNEDVFDGCEEDIASLESCHECYRECLFSCGSDDCVDVIELEAGTAHTCAVHEDGTASCWGRNDEGRIGDSTSGTDRYVATSVSVLSSVSYISAGRLHTCAIDGESSDVYCWGSDENGQLGNGGAGSTVFPQSFGLTGVQSISAGHAHTCAVHSNGIVQCWGSKLDGRLGDYCSIGECSGSRESPVDVYRYDETVTNGKTVKVGRKHSCVLLDSGLVECWGDNFYGQLGDGADVPNSDYARQVSGLSDVTTIAAGSYHNCAISDGDIYCWGSNYFKQLGQSSGETYNTPQQVSGLSNVSAITAGSNFSCALSDGQVFCWGANDKGQLGSSSADTHVPTTVMADESSPLTNVTRIAAGSEHACALTTSGQAYCWGWNAYGQLGNNSATEDAPNRIPSELSPLNSI